MTRHDNAMNKHNGKRMINSAAGNDGLEAEPFLHELEAERAEEVTDPATAKRLAAEREFAARNEPVMDEEDAVRRAIRETALRGLAHHKGVFASIYAFRGDLKFALDCAVAAYGFFEILGVRDFVQLAERHGCTKANVVKLVKQIQMENNLPPTAKQREKDGCQNMRAVRIKQTKRE